MIFARNYPILAKPNKVFLLCCYDFKDLAKTSMKFRKADTKVGKIN
jgi:hypothetical protein